MAIIAVMICALVAGACSLASAERAWAGGNPGLDALMDKPFTLSYKGKAHDMGYRDYYAASATGGKITQVKSSNKAVAAAKVMKQKMKDYQTGKTKTIYYLRVMLKKAGTTMLSFTHNGRSYSSTYTVKKYVNPLSSLKVGSRNFASYANPSKLGKYCYYASTVNVPVKSFSGKVKVAAKSGWKIDQILAYPEGAPYKVIKNGGKVKDARQIGVMLTHKKTGQWEAIYMTASRSASNSAVRTASHAPATKLTNASGLQPANAGF